jgi:hypothetical protein
MLVSTRVPVVIVPDLSLPLLEVGRPLENPSRAYFFKFCFNIAV